MSVCLSAACYSCPFGFLLGLPLKSFLGTEWKSLAAQFLVSSSTPFDEWFVSLVFFFQNLIVSLLTLIWWWTQQIWDSQDLDLMRSMNRLPSFPTYLLSWRNLMKNLRLESFFVLLRTQNKTSWNCRLLQSPPPWNGHMLTPNYGWWRFGKTTNSWLALFLHNNETVRNWWQRTLGRASFWSSPCHFFCCKRVSYWSLNQVTLQLLLFKWRQAFMQGQHNPFTFQLYKHHINDETLV